MAEDMTPSTTGASLEDTERKAAASRARPEYMEMKYRLHRRLLERIHLGRLAEIDAPRVRGEVRSAVAALVAEDEQQLAPESTEQLIEEILNEVFGLGPLEALMQDPTVSDILVTTPELVHVERFGKLEKTSVRFKDNAHLQRIIQKIVGQAGRRIDEASPMVDARLPDGSRVNAVIAPVAVKGPLLSIRRFSREKMTAADLVEMGSADPRIVEFLSACVRARLNILITGGTGSGKTTLLNVLSSFIGADERIVTIEDTAELQLQQEHVASMETRPPNIEGQGAIRQRQLVINSLRMRPDRIVVGEVRGEEVLDMMQAMNTGHDGSLATIHANNCVDAVSRLELMVNLANSNISAQSIRKQIAAAIHVYVHIARLNDGTRRITQVAESAGLQDGEVALRDVFVFEILGVSADGRVEGDFRATGSTPRFWERLRRSQPTLAEDLFEPIGSVDVPS